MKKKVNITKDVESRRKIESEQSVIPEFKAPEKTEEYAESEIIPRSEIDEVPSLETKEKKGKRKTEGNTEAV